MMAGSLKEKDHGPGQPGKKNQNPISKRSTVKRALF
jgi:hypothetical protein